MYENSVMYGATQVNVKDLEEAIRKEENNDKDCCVKSEKETKKKCCKSKKKSNVVDSGLSQVRHFLWYLDQYDGLSYVRGVGDAYKRCAFDGQVPCFDPYVFSIFLYLGVAWRRAP